MLSKYRKDYEKTVMGYLSYLDDFKNLENLKEEMQLYTDPEDDQFNVLIYNGSHQDPRGIIGVQSAPGSVVIRYLSLDPSYRNDETRQTIMKELKQYYPDKNITALPDYTYLLKFLRTKGKSVNDEK